MKFIFAFIIVFGLNLNAQTCNENTCKSGKDCEVVRVVTRCDVDKQKLRNKIFQLEKQIDELKSEIVVLQNLPTRREVITQTEKITDQVVKHNLISLYAAPDVTGTGTSLNGNSATATVNTGYVPGLMYQYQFNSGITPGVGISTNGHPALFFGYGF